MFWCSKQVLNAVVNVEAALWPRLLHRLALAISKTILRGLMSAAAKSALACRLGQGAPELRRAGPGQAIPDPQFTLPSAVAGGQPRPSDAVLAQQCSGGQWWAALQGTHAMVHRGSACPTCMYSSMARQNRTAARCTPAAAGSVKSACAAMSTDDLPACNLPHCAAVAPQPVQALGPHVAPLGLLHWPAAGSRWPATYHGSIFVGEHG